VEDLQPTETEISQEYNGSTWTAVNNMNTARGAGGSSGIQTSAVAFGGQYTSHLTLELQKNTMELHG
jgi:hypothetical protein